VRRHILTIILALIFHNSQPCGQAAMRFDVLITEIFPDPSPQIGLPPTEFIELKNVSATPLNLKNWQISDENSTAVISINYILQPDSVVIICANSATTIFSSFGNPIGVSNFPSLDNDADLIFVRSFEGTIIHAISYNKALYHNELKAIGGRTLEMIDVKNPCGGITNWRASTDPSGGTPGRKNSVTADNKDVEAPALLRTYTIDSITIVAVFDESVDSLSAAFPSRYRLNHTHINPDQAIPVEPVFNEVILKFSKPLSKNTVYDLTVTGISDCSGNIIGLKNKARAGLTSHADRSDIIINEILFNPKADGADFIELYNKGKNILNLQHLYAANQKATGMLDNITQLSGIPYLLFPGDYIVYTENKQWLVQNYTVKKLEDVVELSSLPSLPDDEGNLVILNLQREIIDELQYDSKWHFALIDNDEGISLERIDYSAPTQDKNNWTSAASTADFATPGYQNSQFKIDQHIQGGISVVPKVFSPDNDGFDDLADISYRVEAGGYIANITIFDANGRPVRYLAKNVTLALQGHFRWDGLDDKLQRLPLGIYIVFTEIFNLQGKTKKFKNVVTLARRI
jgi:Lamin Tail Domain